MRSFELVLAAIFAATCLFQIGAAESRRSAANLTDRARAGKLFPVFQIVTFPNDVCNSNSAGRNGTCYTADECSNVGGTSSGTCADGFGVCCVLSLACGETSSQNNTYLIQSSVTSTTPSPCVYTICRASTDICRIRLDFNSFELAAPVAGEVLTAAGTIGGAVGDCTTDQFSVSAPGNEGTPIICGSNTGQHIFVDASAMCNRVVFNLGSGATDSRSWDVKVTQYECGHLLAGPPDCLQYHTGTSGAGVRSFNFPSSGQAATTSTHLSNQHYNICFRRESSRCAICFTASQQIIAPGSFGLSNDPATAINSGQGTDCSTDYLTINGAEEVQADGSPALAIGTIPTATPARLCGRALTVIAQTATDAYTPGTQVSVCTQSRPFQVGVDFNDIEAQAGTVGTTNEFIGQPYGYHGFSLDYTQISC